MTSLSVRRAIKGTSDFDVYYAAGERVLRGMPLYSSAGRAIDNESSPFLYPPFFAYVFSILSLLSVPFAAWLWSAFNFLCLIFGFVLILEMIREGPWTARPVFYYLVFFLLFVLVSIDNLIMAQANPVVFFLLILSLYYLFKGRDVLSGVSLAAAISVKLVPGIFLFYFLIKKKWRALASALVSLLFFFFVIPSLLVGTQKNLDYHTEWFSETIKAQAEPAKLPYYSSQLSPSHQNLSSVLFRLVIDWKFREETGGENGRRFLYRPPWRLSQSEASFVAGLALAGISFFALFCLLKNKPYSRDIIFKEIALTLVTMVLLSPKLRSHGLIHLVYPWFYLAFLLVSGRRLDDKGARGAFILSAVFYLLQAVRYFKFLGSGCISALILFIFYSKSLLAASKS